MATSIVMADCIGNKKQFGCIQRRRGRPLGSTTKKRRRLLSGALGESQPQFVPGPDVSFSSQMAYKLSLRYQDAAKQYAKTGLNERILHILRRMACGRIFAMETQRGPVQQYLSDVSKLLFLNELELVVWDLYLIGTYWRALPMSFQTLLVVSAYYVKTIMSAIETPHILNYLTKRIPQFQGYLATWTTYCGATYSVNPKELQKHYMKLIEPLSEDESNQLNYNYYVDDIINLGCATVDEIAGSQPAAEPIALQEAETEPDSFVPLTASMKAREDMPITPSVLMMEELCFSPLLFHYPFAYYTPPQSGLPMMEDMENGQFRPVEK